MTTNNSEQDKESNNAPAKRVLLLTTPSSYRTGAFMSAAERLGLEVLQGIDLPDKLAAEWNVPLGLDYTKPEAAAEKVAGYVRENPVSAIVALDDSATILAALASRRAGLPHNSPEAALAARDKFQMREMLTAHGAPSPSYQRFGAKDNETWVGTQVLYPCVVKPTRLNGSRGVIRANNPEELAKAFIRTRGVIRDDGQVLETSDILIEEYVPGVEVALEGLMSDGSLQTLAIFDKPDPMEGPFFEETIYVTPSRLPSDTLQAISDATAKGAEALGLRQGPVHAELRVNERGAWIIEIAGRSIGGLCSTILEFGTGYSLEELILTQAVEGKIAATERSDQSVGVMMIPIPGAGILRGVSGIEDAEQVDGVTGIEITARLNHRLVPLPEGASYLGFIFAKGDTPEAVEASLRKAHARLEFRISPEIPLLKLS